MKYIGWKQKVWHTKYGREPGWWWMCSELRRDTEATSDVGALRPCQRTSQHRSIGGGFSSISGALRAALAHRYQCHYRGRIVDADLWAMDSERFWYMKAE